MTQTQKNQQDFDDLNRNTDGFAQIIDRYTDFTFAVAFRLLNNHEDAKDISQDAFVKLWENRKKYNPKIKLTTWLYKIITNTCLDYLKKQKNQPDSEKILNTLPETAFLPDTKLENKQIGEIIQALSNELTPKQKTVFVLSDLEELSADEISEITGMSKSTIKSNLYHARNYIKSKLI